MSRHLHAHADECKKDAKETSLEMTHVSIVNITFNIIQLTFVFTINVNGSSFSWFYGVIMVIYDPYKPSGGFGGTPWDAEVISTCGSFVSSTFAWSRWKKAATPSEITTVT